MCQFGGSLKKKNAVAEIVFVVNFYYKHFDVAVQIQKCFPYVWHLELIRVAFKVNAFCVFLQ